MGHARVSKLGSVLALVLALTGVSVPTASAAVTVSRAEISGTQLRLEGRALANRSITVDGVQMGTSDGSGNFRIERSNYTRPADCTIDVNDGSATPANARLSGCTVTSVPAAPTVSSLGLSPGSVTGGSSSTGTVTLSAAAPSGGQVVSLASNTPSAASVPSTVTVPAGATSRTFTVTTSAVTASTPVTITATGGGVARSAVLTVTPGAAAAPTLSGLSLSPTAVPEGSTSTGTVTLTGPAPAGGVTVSLTSGNATAASVPGSVTVPAGATSATFTVTALSTASTSGSVITATAGGVARTATLTVNDSTPTLNNLSIVPLSVTGGSTTTGTVTLTAPATAGGVVVSLSSDQPFASVPPSVTVAAGDELASFTISTTAVDASTSALIRATHGSATRAFTLAVTPAATGPALSAVTLSATDVVGGTPVTGTVTLVSAAPAGGQRVVLTSDNTNAATVPPSVTVPAGATRATFPVTTKPVASADSATIVGEAGGARRGATITVRSAFNANNGSVSLARGGNGEGRVVSTPAGIDCTLTRTGSTGRCGNAFFPVGTRVRLDARPLAGSSFQGWDFEVSCRNAPNVTIAAGVAHICRPVFRLR